MESVFDDRERQRRYRRIDSHARHAARDPRASWPASDVFGTLSRAGWGALLRTHINHHLKQFGA
jgi:hypothetical protein